MSRPRKIRRRLFALLALTLLISLTLIVVAILTFKNRPTVVELKLVASRVGLEIIPPSDVVGEEGSVSSRAPAVVRQVSLFHPALTVQALELREVDCVETTLEQTGRTVLRPGPAGKLLLHAVEPFTPELILREATDVTLEAVGRHKVRISLSQERPVVEASGRVTASAAEPRLACGKRAAANEGWSGRIPSASQISLRAQGVQAVGPAGRVIEEFSGSGEFVIPPNSLDLRLAGGRTLSWMNLALPADDGAATRMVIIDPARGEIGAVHRLPEPISEARAITWTDRIVLLDPLPPEGRPVLRPDLQVRELELTRWVEFEARSALLGGTVRFPAGEKDPIELERGFFLTLGLRPERPLTLRSIDFLEGQLALDLWAEPTSIRIGPTPELQSERLPCYLEWLYTHRLGSLAYGAVAWIAAAALGGLKLLGIARD